MRWQNLLYSILVGVVVLLIIFLGRSGWVEFVRSSVVRVFRPLLEVGHALERRLSGGSGGGSDDGERLRVEENRLQKMEQEYTLLQNENNSLRNVVGLADRERVSLVGAHIVLHGNEFGKEFLILNSGAGKKIREGALVIDSDGGVVGVVREAGSDFAKVSIASNPGETFEVTMAPLDVRALARGIGNRSFSIELIPDETPVRVGDFALMPSRLGDASAFVAEVTTITSSGVGAFQKIRATLITRPETLDMVFVLTN